MTKNEAIQNRINDIISSIPRKFRQYAPAKWQLNALTEAGLIEFMPAGFGSSDADAVCKDACIGKYAGQSAEDGAGDETWIVAHLAVLLSEVEAEAEAEAEFEEVEAVKYETASGETWELVLLTNGKEWQGCIAFDDEFDQSGGIDANSRDELLDALTTWAGSWEDTNELYD